MLHAPSSFVMPFASDPEDDASFSGGVPAGSAPLVVPFADEDFSAPLAAHHELDLEAAPGENRRVPAGRPGTLGFEQRRFENGVTAGGVALPAPRRWPVVIAVAGALIALLAVIGTVFLLHGPLADAPVKKAVATPVVVKSVPPVASVPPATAAVEAATPSKAALVARPPRRVTTASHVRTKSVAAAKPFDDSAAAIARLYGVVGRELKQLDGARGAAVAAPIWKRYRVIRIYETMQTPTSRVAVLELLTALRNEIAGARTPAHP